MLVCQYVCLALVYPRYIFLFSVARETLHHSSLLFLEMRWCTPAVMQYCRCHVDLMSASVLFSLPRWNTLRGERRTWSWPGSILLRHSSWTTETWGPCLACIWWVTTCAKAKENKHHLFSSWHIKVLQGEQRCLMPQKVLVSADSDSYLGKAVICIISEM